MLQCHKEVDMDTKGSILSLLEKRRGEFLSGEEIAAKLNLTRTAVWKAVRALENDGHDIVALRNKGYCLSVSSDIISAVGVKKYLNENCSNFRIEVFPTLTSTNTYAREKADCGEKEGYVVIAASQTDGKGRKGRSFYSPPGSGLYMSVLLRPTDLAASDAVKITTIAAVAVCEAIESLSDDKAEIKWVNDVFSGGKKVCGIFTEAAFSLESDCIDHAVLGIGVNVSEPEGGFPPELKDIVGCVHLSTCDGKNRLAAEILNRFSEYYFSRKNYVDKYRARSMVIGKKVLVLRNDEAVQAVATGIDDKCRLIVEYGNGSVEHLSSGEISVKIEENI